jgi:phosphoglycerate dehydrogenase-like enzyme
MPALIAPAAARQSVRAAAPPILPKIAPTPRVPEARKGREYKSRQTNVNEADAAKMRSEIRNENGESIPKPETRNKCGGPFRHSGFGFDSSFGSTVLAAGGFRIAGCRSPPYSFTSTSVILCAVWSIWCNARLAEASQARLAAAISPHRLLLSPRPTSNLTSAGADPLLAEADIAFGQPDPVQLLTLGQLRWIQLSSAGYTRYDRADIRDALRRRNAAMTNSSSVFDEPCALHVLAFMLAHARVIPRSLANQVGPRAWPIVDLRRQCRLFVGQSGLLLGFGAIARRLTELLQPLHMHVSAIRQNPRGDEPIPVHPVSDLEKHLPAADHVVNVLPDSSATRHFMNAARFAVMKPGAVFYNIGRGTTVDQKALLASLNSGHLAAAYLDVTDPEPLPPDHPLWLAATCVITPHIGGGHIDEFDRVVDHFIENFRRFQAGQSLLDRII